MKKLFLLLTVLVTTLTVQAEGYTYLTFETTEGAKASVSVENLTLTVNDGTVKATSSGSQYKYSSSATASPKAIKADGGIVINGGTVYAKSSSHEGIESKGTLTITGGNVYAESSDDAINSAGDMTISGG